MDDERTFRPTANCPQLVREFHIKHWAYRPSELIHIVIQLQKVR